ncbi:MAG: glycosyltransferase family 4 protein [Phycisphaerae bacterium]|nr:glycosyltransferase family 4 protein [Phycisphaerae bacterium]
MNIWLVNPFDPLPGDPEQEGRYATLAGLLLNRGHKVVWWTSSFSHRFKKPVDQSKLTRVCNEIGMDVKFIESPQYTKNVSIKRLWNHYLLSKRFASMAANVTLKPDVVLASAPPPMLARNAVKIASQFQAKSIVDIQDLWPETFYRLAPAPVRASLSMALSPWQKASTAAYCNADVVAGVADEYVNRALELGATPKSTATIPLGIDLASFNKAAAEGYTSEFTKPEGEIWFAYTGSLNRSYDCITLTKAFLQAKENLKCPAKLFITGRGEYTEEIKKNIDDCGTKDVVLTGFVDFPQWAYLLKQCDVGFNASFPEAMIYLPNKIFYYFAAGLAVLNTIPGQCSNIVSGSKSGLDYQAGNTQSCIEAIEKVASNADILAEMKYNSHQQAVTIYDRNILYSKFVDLIEK